MSLRLTSRTWIEIVDCELHLGTLIGIFVAVRVEIKRRKGLGLQRADDLKRLWRGTGISRKCKIELCDSLIGTTVVYGRGRHDRRTAM